jgi:hypothetical protein
LSHFHADFVNLCVIDLCMDSTDCVSFAMPLRIPSGLPRPHRATAHIINKHDETV